MSLCVVALLGGGCGARGGRGGGGGSRRSALVSVVMEKCSRKGSVIRRQPRSLVCPGLLEALPLRNLKRSKRMTSRTAATVVSTHDRPVKI